MNMITASRFCPEFPTPKFDDLVNRCFHVGSVLFVKQQDWMVETITMSLHKPGLRWWFAVPAYAPPPCITGESSNPAAYASRLTRTDHQFAKQHAGVAPGFHSSLIVSLWNTRGQWGLRVF
jgi:hypothetical protein